MTKDTPKTTHSSKHDHSDYVKTYQDALDEAIEETFPASDPISPSHTQKIDRPISTKKNSVDWRPLKSHANKREKTVKKPK